MMGTLRLVSAGLLSIALGVSITLHIALRRFQCTGPDGAEQALFGMLSPYRSEFTLDAADIPILWLSPFLMNALVVSVLSYVLFGRSVARGRSATSPAANIAVPLIFTAILGFLSIQAAAPYAIETSGFPVATETSCERTFEYAPGAAATSFGS